MKRFEELYLYHFNVKHDSRFDEININMIKEYCPENEGYEVTFDKYSDNYGELINLTIKKERIETVHKIHQTCGRVRSAGTI